MVQFSENAAQAGKIVVISSLNGTYEQRPFNYVLDLVHTSREEGPGLSPRASQGLLRAAKAWALLEGASQVTPDHVQAVFGAVEEHRLDGGHRRAIPLSQTLLERVDALR